MPNTAFEESPQGAARALVEHLRQNPGETRDPAGLAARFGLETEFVRRALTRLAESEVRAEASRGPNRIAERAGGAVAWADDALERAAENPMRFAALSLLMVGAIVVGLSLLYPAAAPGSAALRASVRGGFSATLILLTVALHMAVFYRRRMVRYALYGGLLFSGLSALATMVMTWADLQRHPRIATDTDLKQGVLVFLAGIAMLFVGTLYTTLAVLASLAGGWVRLRREDREWEQLSRQELLERYFELGRRLDRSVATPEEPQTWEALPPIAWVRARPFLAAGLVGLVSGGLNALILTAFGSGIDSTETLQLFAVASSACSIAFFMGVAFLAGKAARGALCALPYTAAHFATVLLAQGALILAGPGDSLRLVSAAFSLALYAFAGALAGAGASVQRRAVREARLQRDDGATLVAEMLEIQWRLEEDATRVTVLVVDAAKSTAMKVGADPLDVEYSFREYQMWIAESCAGFGGRIHSVAGDGAVVAFPDNAAAMAAARRLQTDVPRFNATLNRLPKPFRLRLGLHAGLVAGDLNDVQFTEVIDIAAHVEDISPVGGIAATESAVEGLGEEGFLPLAREVDGQPVFIALVPTEG